MMGFVGYREIKVMQENVAWMVKKVIWAFLGSVALQVPQELPVQKDLKGPRVLKDPEVKPDHKALQERKVSKVHKVSKGILDLREIREIKVLLVPQVQLVLRAKEVHKVLLEKEVKLVLEGLEDQEDGEVMMVVLVQKVIVVNQDLQEFKVKEVPKAQKVLEVL